MPSQPHTWTVAQAVQTAVQGLTVVDFRHPVAASPFATFSASDAATYGATNAIYIGMPKELLTQYDRQCHIISCANEHVTWRTLGSGSAGSGGKVWDEVVFYIRFLYLRQSNWYQTEQDLIAARDAMYPQILMTHTQLPGAAGVQAAHNDSQVGGFPIGHHYVEFDGQSWACWGFGWWIKQEWTTLLTT